MDVDYRNELEHFEDELIKLVVQLQKRTGIKILELKYNRTSKTYFMITISDDGMNKLKEVQL